MALNILDSTEKESTLLDDNFLREENEEHKNLVILMSIFPQIWTKFSECLTVLEFRDAPLEFEVQPLTALDLKSKLDVYGELWKQGLDKTPGKLLPGAREAFTTVQVMLPALSIILNPELLAFSICTSLDERNRANEVAHPSFQTIQRSLLRADPELFPDQVRHLIAAMGNLDAAAEGVKSSAPQQMEAAVLDT